MRLALCTWLVIITSAFGSFAYADPKQDLIGTWRNQRATLEVRPAGKLTATIQKIQRPGSTAKPQSITVHGTYTWVDRATLAVELKLGSDVKKDTLAIKIEGDTLTTTDRAGKVETLERVK